MKARHTAAALAFLLALAPAAYAQTQQPEPPPRRPQGPAAGPVIKLPPGAGAVEERTQTPGAREAAAPPAPTKWEYCVINGFRSHSTGFGSSARRVVVTTVRYLPEGSEDFEGATEDEAVNNALAKLGEDGWELTAIRTDIKLDDGDGGSTSAYFFKRPKRQE